MLKKILEKRFFTWLLPHVCILCNNPSYRKQDLCDACLKDLPFAQKLCQRCAIPLTVVNHFALCGKCSGKSPPFDCTYALFFYQFPVTKLILDLKFQEALMNARVLGELLAEKIKYSYQTKLFPDVIIPIPLHSNRLKERGFNQALEIARPLSNALKLPIDKYSCIRHKPTFAQATLSASKRQKNIQGAFTINPLPYRHVAVVDDVITTGTTISEFCKTLKQQGVETIDVWCIARPRLDYF